MATDMNSEEKEDRRKDLLITLVKIEWT